jgi:outer membrane protein OmpA-like peptidoglycan-associated protein
MIDDADELLALLDSEDEETVRRGMQAEAPSEVWLEALGRRDDLAAHVARHAKHLPASVIRLLAAHASADVRAAAASKGRLPDDLFVVLARDPDETVRGAIVHHRRTPPAILEEMTEDSWQRIRERSFARLGLLPAPRPELMQVVYFDHGGSALDPEALAALTALAAEVRSAEQPDVRLIGFASDHASADQNQALAEARARACQEELVRAGVPGRCVVTEIGVAPPEESSLPHRRRVEIVRA